MASEASEACDRAINRSSDSAIQGTGGASSQRTASCGASSNRLSYIVDRMIAKPTYSACGDLAQPQAGNDYLSRTVKLV